MPRVTLAMPACNGENFIEEAIDSILAQDFRDFEKQGFSRSMLNIGPQTLLLRREFARSDDFHSHSSLRRMVV